MIVKNLSRPSTNQKSQNIDPWFGFCTGYSLLFLTLRSCMDQIHRQIDMRTILIFVISFDVFCRNF